MRNPRSHIVLLFIFLFAFIIAPQGTHAALLKFDKATVSVSAGSTFTIQSIVDAGSDQITSTDAWILYDPTLLEAQVASPGSFFPAVTNNISSGKVYIAGLVTDPGTYKTGTGIVANITFKALKNGTATISYDCRTEVSNSSKVIKNAVDPTNVIVCSQNGTSVVTIGTGGAIVPTSVVPTAVYNNNQTYPTALPQSGIADEMPRLMTMGILFVIIGAVMRALLLL